MQLAKEGRGGEKVSCRAACLLAGTLVALTGRLKFMVRRQKFNKDSLILEDIERTSERAKERESETRVSVRERRDLIVVWYEPLRLARYFFFTGYAAEFVCDRRIVHQCATNEGRLLTRVT